MHVGRKRSNDDSLFGMCCKNACKRGANRLFRGGMSGTLGVGRLAHQHKYTTLTKLAQANNIHHFAINGGGVEFKVTRVQNCSKRSVQSNGTGIGNGVVDVDEFRGNATKLNGVTCIDYTQIRLPREGMLFQLVSNDSKRERCAVNGNVDAAKQIGNSADVILVPVCQKDGTQTVLVCFEVGNILNNEVNARHIVFGKAETAVNHNHIVVVFNHGHVFANLSETAQRDDADFARYISFFLFFWHVKNNSSFL